MGDLCQYCSNSSCGFPVVCDKFVANEKNIDLEQLNFIINETRHRDVLTLEKGYYQRFLVIDSDLLTFYHSLYDGIRHINESLVIGDNEVCLEIVDIVDIYTGESREDIYNILQNNYNIPTSTHKARYVEKYPDEPWWEDYWGW
jgi:hypothetical protein